MRFNEKEMKHFSKQKKWDKEGKLLYKGPKSQSYKDRWFRLIGNILFYYKTNEQGTQPESEASGVLILERCRIQHQPIADRPFVFTIAFPDDREKQHYFSGSSEKQCEDWIKMLRKASYEELRCTMTILKAKILKAKNQDPMMAFSHRSSHNPVSTRAQFLNVPENRMNRKVRSVPELRLDLI
ncbi:pleckstrin homology domain-containing family J member 1-like [Tubulanus polymorphus]|uniref:pleckstrin homology domain-containing family J member 1-like n=1 Tax=Tubulanus polymorphus TaxID=672921 RepID=UPI003DA6358E